MFKMARDKRKKSYTRLDSDYRLYIQECLEIVQGNNNKHDSQFKAKEK